MRVAAPSDPKRLAKPHESEVIRFGGSAPMAGSPYLVWLSLDLLERCPGGVLRPLPIKFARSGYRSRFVARRSAEDLPSLRQLEAVVCQTALATPSIRPLE